MDRRENVLVYLSASHRQRCGRKLESACGQPTYKKPQAVLCWKNSNQ